jgi:metal-sulfur cluster biosynthetic enzyme
VGQTTSADALDEARDALADVADVEITVTVTELSTEARR